MMWFSSWQLKQDDYSTILILLNSEAYKQWKDNSLLSDVIYQ